MYHYSVLESFDVTAKLNHETSVHQHSFDASAIRLKQLYLAPGISYRQPLSKPGSPIEMKHLLWSIFPREPLAKRATLANKMQCHRQPLCV